jgi:hypothetical protein
MADPEAKPELLPSELPDERSYVGKCSNLTTVKKNSMELSLHTGYSEGQEAPRKEFITDQGRKFTKARTDY